jgi:hypothetical protein
MSPSLNPLNWGKPKIDPLLQQAALTYAAQESAKTSADIEFEKELGVNRELLHDPHFETLLEDDIYIKRPLQDEKGNLILHEGQIQYVILGKDKHAETLRAIFSQLNRTSFISEKEAKLQTLLLRLALLKLRASKPEPTYTMADSAWYNVMEWMGRNIISDCVKGRKAQLLKRISKATAVEVSQRTETKGDRLV